MLAGDAREVLLLMAMSKYTLLGLAWYREAVMCAPFQGRDLRHSGLCWLCWLC